MNKKIIIAEIIIVAASFGSICFLNPKKPTYVNGAAQEGTIGQKVSGSGKACRRRQLWIFISLPTAN